MPRQKGLAAEFVYRDSFFVLDHRTSSGSSSPLFIINYLIIFPFNIKTFLFLKSDPHSHFGLHNFTDIQTCLLFLLSLFLVLVIVNVFSGFHLTPEPLKQWRIQKFKLEGRRVVDGVWEGGF